MEQHQDIHELITAIQRENRSMRRIFGVSIIILSLTLMVIAPIVIRLAIQEPSQDQRMYEMRENIMHITAPSASTTSSTSESR